MTIGLMFLYSIGGYTASENIVIGTMFVCLNMFMLAQQILDKIESSK